jgi:hypothetical protein
MRGMQGMRGMQRMHIAITESCDALRCSGPHARYTDEGSEFYPGSEGLGNLLKLRRDGDRSL